MKIKLLFFLVFSIYNIAQSSNINSNSHEMAKNVNLVFYYSPDSTYTCDSNNNCDCNQADCDCDNSIVLPSFPTKMVDSIGQVVAFTKLLIQELGITSISIKTFEVRELINCDFKKFFEDHESCYRDEVRVYINRNPNSFTPPKYFPKGQGHFIHLPFYDKFHPIVLLHEMVHWLFGEEGFINLTEEQKHVTSIQHIAGVELPFKTGCLNLMYTLDIVPLNFLLSEHQRKIINSVNPDEGCINFYPSCFYQTIPLDFTTNSGLNRDLCCLTPLDSVIEKINEMNVDQEIMTIEEAKRLLSVIYSLDECPIISITNSSLMLQKKIIETTFDTKKIKNPQAKMELVKNAIKAVHLRSPEIKKGLEQELKFLNSIAKDKKYQLGENYIKSRMKSIERNLKISYKERKK